MDMEVEDPFPDELVLPETVLTMLDWPLPPPVEALLQEICREQSQEPPDAEVRRRLADIGEDGAIKILKRISCCTIRHLSSFIIFMVNRYPECISEDNRRSHESTPPLSRSFSPLGKGVQVEGLHPLKAKRRLSFCSEPPPECSERGSSGMISEQLKLLSQLEFRKLFLILSYIGSRKKLEDVVSPNEAADILGIWGNLPMTEFESRIWNAYGRQNYDGDRPKYLDWDSGKTHMYYCNVDQGGNCTFKGVRLTTTRTHLQRALGDENVLCVRFPAENECCPKMIADEGILVGLRRYRFFVSSIAKYIARFSLILSKTIKFPIDLANVDIQDIEDIPCRDANGHIVYDEDGEPRIHTDGTGYISEDLALKCPKGFRSAKFISDGNFEQFQGFTELEDTNMEGIQYWNREPPPLLMQFRMFNNGCAIKGTLLINKQIGPGKIQIRPKMVKVEKDPKILATSTFNSLEIVAISHKPRRANLSKFLILLLSYGGVPEEYFLALMKNAWEEIKTIYTDKRAALRAAVRYGETDNEFTTAKLISSGVPMDEPYLQDCLSRLANMEKDNLKTGKLPTSDSYYLMGTADPTGTLNSDEVCVILDNGHVTGKVLVYKHPGLHFGDIHIMNAKYVEELNHIVGNAKYGIFFSTKGPISAASEIANSDFDGDMYWVSMNPQLLTYYKASEPWSRIHAVPKAVTKRPSEFMPDELEYELLRVFLEGKKLGNNMAVAADGWLACMDQFLTLGNNCTKEKPADLKRKILHLIDLYYEALDAPKTGKTVNIPRKLMPEKYPHYMERRPSYQSTSVLEIWKLPCFEVEVPETCLSLWKERYHKEYLPEMSEAMNCGPPKSEARKVAANNVMKKYKQLLYEAGDFEESRRKDDDIFNEALAIYHVCYDYAKMSNDVRKCGFAWRVAASALCKYHAFKQKDRPILILPSILQEILR
nr:probable RNA-dependent RNA polymerase 3 isoform X1 [Ipomoea batatas]